MYYLFLVESNKTKYPIIADKDEPTNTPIFTPSKLFV